MPFLAIVHLQEARCDRCGAVLAPPGARSFVVDDEGSPVLFDADDPAVAMTVELPCPNGHAVTRLVPSEISAEETLMTPERAPIAADAVLRSGMTESGKVL
jgi:hypothetical protein